MEMPEEERGQLCAKGMDIIMPVFSKYMDTLIPDCKRYEHGEKTHDELSMTIGLSILHAIMDVICQARGFDRKNMIRLVIKNLIEDEGKRVSTNEQ